MLAAPASTQAQHPDRGLGCHAQCWARASFFGTATCQCGFWGTPLTASFDLDSNTAFLVDYANADHLIFAHLHGTMSSYRAVTTQKLDDGCKPHVRKAVTTVAGRVPLTGGYVSVLRMRRNVLAIIAYVGKSTTGMGRMTAPGATCTSAAMGQYEVPAVNQTVPYYWPFLGRGETRDEGWLLEPYVKLHPGQRVFSKTLTFHDAGKAPGSSATWDNTVTAHVFIELCPDQNLARNCQIPEMPDLPQK